MLVKTSELTGAALDWAVARCEGKDNDCEIHAGNVLYGRITSGFIQYQPSTDWAQGGAIIDRERFTRIFVNVAERITVSNKREVLDEEGDLVPQWVHGTGQTVLIAAMRCYVATKLGDEVDVPEELTNVR